MSFVPLSREECERAVGLADDVPPVLRRALQFDESIELLPPPGPHDWLSIHDERGQTFRAFQAAAATPVPAAQFICIQPIDDVLLTAGPCFDHLVEFTRAFFGRDVVVLPPASLPTGRLRSRMEGVTRQIQYFAGDILLELAGHRPPDALCLLGLTSHDIYPDVFVQYAFGEASFVHRVALCSMARYGPPYREECAGQPTGAKLRRCARVLSHEVCHMLGIQHCIYARCLMNGSAEVTDSDRRPLHLCPVDLHKLQWVLGFNIVERYRNLLHFWSRLADDEEEMWVSRRLRHVLDGWGAADMASEAPAPR